MKYQILNGHSAELLKQFPDNHFDSVVTDPPYLIGFLGKDWDAANNFQLDVYKECLRVLKPGGHILAFSAARTYHHLAITLEQAGFEIRDQIMWIYSSGFPKSQDVGRSIQRSLGVKETRKHKNNVPRIGGAQEVAEEKEQIVVTDPQAQQWEGWGTALKPAHEPIALARKPMKTSTAKNVQQWGTGALNIDATRIPSDTPPNKTTMSKSTHANLNAEKNADKGFDEAELETWEPNEQGRFPSNVLGDIPDYQKYFYCPKVSRKERHMGFNTSLTPTNPNDMWDDGVQFQNQSRQQMVLTALITNDEMLAKMGGYFIDQTGNKKESQDGSNMLWLPHTGNIYIHGLKHEYEKWCKANNIPVGNVGNNHPTVKPVALMQYLIKLITPAGGTVLDPFNGSGSTGMAAVGLGFNYIGCELDPNYVAISEQRIQAWLAQDPITASGLFE